MLRNFSRTVSSKQARMADHNSVPSPTQNHTRPITSFFGAETIMSPTSILDNIKISYSVKPFGYDKNRSKHLNTFSENKHYENLDSGGIGLALIDSLDDEKSSENFGKPNTRIVLFGSKLKIQIPPFPPSAISSSESPKSPADFGIRTRSCVNSGIQTKDSPRDFTGGLSLSEMELSEDYTCVISHGPSPRTTHIYDNCIVERCCGGGGVGLSELKKEHNSKSHSQNFCSLCYTCKKNIGEDTDIYMYRGEKAFCSHECGSQEMLLDGMKNLELNDVFRT